MNTYFEHNNDFNSNKRIMEAYFGEAISRPRPFARALEALLSLLFRLWQILTCPVGRRIIKASSVAVSLVGLVGIVGAIEQGTLGLGIGLLLGAILVAIEYLCLRPRRI